MLRIINDKWPEIYKNHNFSRKSVKIGFIEGKPIGYPDPIFKALNKRGHPWLLKFIGITPRRYSSISDVATVAFKHEFGAGVPMRPFLGPSFDMSYKLIENICNMAANGRILFPYALLKIGELHRRNMISYINALWSPPNSPIEIAAKGHNKPLIWDGKMRNSIDFRLYI